MEIKLGKLKNYFNNDELASNVWLTKYALKDKSGKVLEETPDDMHNRIASEFARIEEKFGGENITAAQMRKILDAYDVRMQNAGRGQTGLFEDMPDNLIDDTLNSLDTVSYTHLTLPTKA